MNGPRKDMASSTVSRALSGYRRLLRSQRQLFAGDHYAQTQARVEIRSHFENNRGETDPAQIEQMLTMVDEAEDMILHGVMQGQLNPQTGNYEVKVKPEHTTKVEEHATRTTDQQPTADDSNPNVVVTSYKPDGK